MNKNKFYKISLIIAIIILAVLVYLSFIDKTKAIKNPYHAVYLRTGDMYFGKISYFPKFVLSDIWFLQANALEQKEIDIVKFTNAIFGPIDRMEINKKDIIWIAKLRDDSDLVGFIEQNQFMSLQNTLPTENLGEKESESMETETKN